MTENLKPKLSRDNLARQIHLVLQGMYPDKNLQANVIHKMIIETQPDGAGFKFPANEFAEYNDIDERDLAGKLYKELGVEFEKNLHNKFFFEISENAGSISFKMIGDDSGD